MRSLSPGGAGILSYFTRHRTAANLLLMLLVVAVSSMLSSSLPIAAFAATFPVTAAIAIDLALQGTLRNYILAIMAVAAG